MANKMKDFLIHYSFRYLLIETLFVTFFLPTIIQNPHKPQHHSNHILPPAKTTQEPLISIRFMFVSCSTSVRHLFDQNRAQQSNAEMAETAKRREKKGFTKPFQEYVRRVSRRVPVFL